MAEKALGGYNISNHGAQVINAPKKQPKSTGTKATRGTDLRSGK